MKKGVIVGIVILAVLIIVFGVNYSLTGSVVSDEVMGDSGDGYGGPSAEDIKCLEECIIVGCEYGDENCINANSQKCEQECGVEPEPSGELGEGEQCVQDCLDRDCVRGPDYANCIESVRGSCDKECGMIGEPEAQSEEEQCIRDCINKINPNIQCSHGTFEGEGETGNKACQKCAKECEQLYSGPCLTDELWTEKENECMATGEHMEAAPVRGDSGEGYECTVDIECIDRSSEWGDDAGTGEDSWGGGHGSSEDNVYWGDYKSDLEVSGSQGTLSIRNTNRKNIGKKIEVGVNVDEDISLEQKGEKLVVKDEEVEIEIDNNMDSLVISENGNRREIDNIDIGIEEGKPVYRYEEKERARLFGFIPVGKNVQKKVDAENMEMIEEDGPWWEFLSVEVKNK